LKRVLGLFAYYAQWIKQYSDKVKPLSAVGNSIAGYVAFCACFVVYVD